jgi:muconolactone delta-isomerase
MINMRSMIHFTFIRGQREAIAALVPAEQARVKTLTEQGLMETGYLAADGSGGWMVLQGESEEQIRQTMATLPLHPYMELEYTPLRDIVPGQGRTE